MAKIFLWRRAERLIRKKTDATERVKKRILPSDPPPFYEAHIFVCTNERPPGHARGCCKEKGSDKLRNYMHVRAKELGIKTRVNTAGCLNRCEEGPAFVIYPEGIWYNPKTNADIDEILQKHMVEGGRVPRLMMDKQ